MLYSLLLLLLTQVSVSSDWISVGSWDVAAVLNPITSRTWSFFNVIVAFAWVFIVVFFVKLILSYLKLWK